MKHPKQGSPSCGHKGEYILTTFFFKISVYIIKINELSKVSELNNFQKKNGYQVL
jgi:hypothetical protein